MSHDWQNEAACRGRGHLLFFGPEGEYPPARRVREAEAKAVCTGCPVRFECLNFAVSRPEKYGFWGGANEDERAILRRRRRQRVNAA